MDPGHGPDSELAGGAGYSVAGKNKIIIKCGVILGKESLHYGPVTV